MSVRIMSKIWDMNGLSPMDKLALLALADWANDDGLAWPSIKQIATKTGCAERSIHRAFRRAEEAGLLTKQTVVGKGCKYTIDPCHSVTPDTVAPLTDSHKTPDTVAHNTPRHTNVDKAKALPTKRAAKIQSKPDGVSEEVWIDWVALRKAKKASVSQTAINGIAREADRAGWPLEDALAEMVSRNWQGFKADWVKENGGNNRNGSNRTLDAAAAVTEMVAARNAKRAAGERGGGDSRIDQVPQSGRAIGYVQR